MKEGDPLMKIVEDSLHAMFDGDALTIGMLRVTITEDVSVPSNLAIALWWPDTDTNQGQQWVIRHQGALTVDERIEWAMEIVAEISAEAILPDGWFIHGEPEWKPWDEEAARASMPEHFDEWWSSLGTVMKGYYRSKLDMHVSFREAKNEGETSS